MALPAAAAAAAAAGRQGGTHSVVLPAFCLVSCHRLVVTWAKKMRKMYPATAAVRQGCTRSVVLSSCCLVPVICGVGKISDAIHVDVNVRMGWYIHDYRKCCYITAQLVAIDGRTCYGHAHAPTAQQKYGVQGLRSAGG